MNEETKILIIDDERDICEQLSGLLNDKGFSSNFSFSAEEGVELFKKNKYSLVLLDIWLNNSKFDGFQALEKILQINENVPIIMISGHGNIETAVNSIKKGAYDFIEKPFDSDLLLFKVKKALENFELKREIIKLIKNEEDSNLIAKSQSSMNLFNSLKKISKIDCSVMLIGNMGAGKKFLATKIHNESNRSNKNFRIIDCKKNDQDELQREIFGKEDNQVVKISGILDEVNRGTLLFENIHCLSKVIQGKLLRVLEEKKYYRIGAITPRNINVRIIASSIISLEKIKKTNKLRNDLVKKLDFFTINIPSLIDRKEDIEDLVNFFLLDFANKKNFIKKKFSEDAISFFYNMNCVENISQLKKFVELCCIMLSDDQETVITKNNLLQLMHKFLGIDDTNNFNEKKFFDFSIKDAREHFEKKYLMYNLAKYEYNVSKMSFEIGMERTALYRKLKSMKINVDVKQ